MTGRQLICYILEHHLEDEPVFKNGEFVGYTSEDRVAMLEGVGIATIQAKRKHGLYTDAIEINGKVYLPVDHKLRRQL